MDLKEYLIQVNKTWKPGQENELSHAKLALIEEIGEIAGWYKKHVGYGRDKETIMVGLKEEFGDLLYYMVKFADLKNIDLNIPLIDKVSRVGIMEFLSDMASDIALITWVPDEELSEYVNDLFESLCILINSENWTLSEIAKSNIAKLRLRHGETYKESHLEDRDKKAEHAVING
jgi:NTP pyrophosphatase (non-canonical NTP hydrolase)